MKRAWIVALAVLGLAVVAYAQMPGDPGPGPGPMPRMAPAPPVMVADDGYIYILRGPELLKVKKDNLAVEKSVRLPVPKPPEGQ